MDTEWERLEKLPAWQLNKVRGKKDILEAQREKNKVHLLMDICHLKNAGLEPRSQKFTGRVVLRGDIVKDDSGAHAVSEQGSSASQMTAAKVMDVIARLPDSAGQADAVSADTQVKMEDAPKTAQNSQSQNVLIYIYIYTCGYVFHDTIVQNHGQTSSGYAHPLAGLLWERQF